VARAINEKLPGYRAVYEPRGGFFVTPKGSERIASRLKVFDPEGVLILDHNAADRSVSNDDVGALIVKRFGHVWDPDWEPTSMSGGR
jgi:hypothetical protein